MTREEAKTVFLNRGYVEVEGGTIYDANKWRESCRIISEWLEQEPCEKVAQERYADLCEYFGDAKDILKSRKDFKAWLERVKWHIHKAEELYEKYEYKKEPCTDAVSRQAVLSMQYRIDDSTTLSTRDVVNVDDIEDLPSVNPQLKTGHWIIKSETSAVCSRCHKNNLFYGDFCKWCGAKMVKPKESEEV